VRDPLGATATLHGPGDAQEHLLDRRRLGDDAVGSRLHGAEDDLGLRATGEDQAGQTEVDAAGEADDVDPGGEGKPVVGDHGIHALTGERPARLTAAGGLDDLVIAHLQRHAQEPSGRCVVLGDENACHVHVTGARAWSRGGR
jgi:hypothetical protein